MLCPVAWFLGLAVSSGDSDADSMVVGPSTVKAKPSMPKPSMKENKIQQKQATAAKSSHDGYGLDENDLHMIDSSLDKRVPSVPKIKKTTAASKAKGKAAAKAKGKAGKAKSVSAKKQVLEEASERPVLEELATAVEGKQMQKKKCSWKHRKTSSAYARERKLRLSMGSSPQTAKKFARAAAAEASAQIDVGLLTED